MTGRRDESLLGSVSYHSSWQGSANVSRFLFRQQMSADLLFVSKCQQTWFSSANVRRCQHHRSFCTGKNSFSSSYVRKCQQIRISSADVSKFVFCQRMSADLSFRQQVSAKRRWRWHNQFSTSQTENGNDFRLRPAWVRPWFTTKRVLPDLPEKRHSAWRIKYHTHRLPVVASDTRYWYLVL